jgi:hypothetical protein
VGSSRPELHWLAGARLESSAKHSGARMRAADQRSFRGEQLTSVPLQGRDQDSLHEPTTMHA